MKKIVIFFLLCVLCSEAIHTQSGGTDTLTWDIPDGVSSVKGSVQNAETQKVTVNLHIKVKESIYTVIKNKRFNE